MTKSILISTIALLTWTTCLPAQDIAWRQMEGPMGANVSAFAFDSDGSIIAALATDLFSSNRLYRFEVSTATWDFLRSVGLVRDIEPLPEGRVLVLTNETLLRLESDGTDWSDVTPPGNPYALVVTSGASILVASSSGVFLQTAADDRWIDVTSGLPRGQVYGLKEVHDVVYALTEASIHRLDDQQRSWTKLGDLPLQSELGVFDFAFGSANQWYVSGYQPYDPEHPDSHGSGIYQSVDSGDVWTKIDEGLSLGFSWLSTDSKGRLFSRQLFIDSPVGGLWLYNRDKQWVNLTSALAPLSWVIESDIVEASDGVVYAGTSAFRTSDVTGLHRFDPETERLIPIELGNIVATTIVGMKLTSDDRLLAHDDRLWNLDPTGNDWLRAPDIDGVRSLDTAPDGLVLVVAGSELVYSNDNGVTWESTTAERIGFSSDAQLTSGGDFVVLTGDSLLLSDDLGTSWRSIQPDGERWVSDFLVAENDHLFALTNSVTYRSTDGGDTWELRRRTSNSSGDLDLLFAGPDGLILAYRSGQGLRRSDDAGATWSSSELSSETVSAIVETSDGALYAATSAGVYRSEDRAVSWTAMNTGLEHISTVSLVMDAHGALYAGTHGGGVYRTESAVGSSAERRPPLPESPYRILSSYPNPARGLTQVHLELDESSPVRIDVVNLLGQSVVTLHNGPMLAGPGALEWNTTGLPPGIYFYRLAHGNRTVSLKFAITHR